MGIDALTDNSVSEAEMRGILPLTLEYVIDKMFKATEGNINEPISKLSLSFYEIYNEKIYDLLVDSKKTQKKEYLELREEKNGNFSVLDLKKVEVNTLE